MNGFLVDEWVLILRLMDFVFVLFLFLFLFFFFFVNGFCGKL